MTLEEYWDGHPLPPTMPNGCVRWMTEVECARYMGFNEDEIDSLPLHLPGVYKALGNAVIVNMAEKHVQRLAIMLLGCGHLTRSLRHTRRSA